MISREEVLNDYDANADYESDLSGTKARAFLAACRRLIRWPNETQGPVNGRTRIDTEAIRLEANKAEAFLAALTRSQTAATGSNMPRQFSRERWQ